MCRRTDYHVNSWTSWQSRWFQSQKIKRIKVPESVNSCRILHQKKKTSIVNHSIFPWSRDQYGPPFDQMSCFHLSQKVDGITKCFIQKTKNKHESDLSGRWDHEKSWQSRRLFKCGITLSESTKIFFQKYLLFRLLRNPGWQLCHSQIIFWCDHCTKGFNQTATHALWICLSWQAGLRFGMASQMLKGVLGLKSLIWAMQKVKLKISNGSKMLIPLIFPSDLRGLDIILLRMFFFRPPRLSHRWAWAVGLTRYRCRITSLTIETQICSTNLPQISPPKILTPLPQMKEIQCTCWHCRHPLWA